MQNCSSFDEKEEKDKQEIELRKEEELFTEDELDRKSIEKNELIIMIQKTLVFASYIKSENSDNIFLINEKINKPPPQEYLQELPREEVSIIREYINRKYHQYILPPDLEAYAIKTKLSPSLSYLNSMTFINLIRLNLKSQMISNLENLTFLSAPQLESLELHNNKIWNMDTLVKAVFPQLKLMSFYFNPIMKKEQFYRINAKELKRYEFDRMKKDNSSLEDYRILFKMQNPVGLKISTHVRRGPRVQRPPKPYFTTLDQSGTSLFFENRKLYLKEVRKLRN